MKAIFAGVAAAFVLLCTGCASVTQGMTHPLRIETVGEKGEQIDGAECTLSNDHGTTLAKSGQPTLARRSSVDMEVACKTAGHPEAKGRLVSRANVGLAGNIIIGGAVGAVVDHSTGAAYTYPSWVRLAFGQSHVYDRWDEQDGAVMMPGASAGKPTPPAKPDPSRPLPGTTASIARADLPPPPPVTRDDPSWPTVVPEPSPFYLRLPATKPLPGIPGDRAAPLPAPRTDLPPPPPVTRDDPSHPPLLARAPPPPKPDYQIDVAGAYPAAVVSSGDTFDYRVTDRMTGREQTVVLRAERVRPGEISFNGGARVEFASGAVTITSAAAGELDQVTPPQGWMPGGIVPAGSWKMSHRSIVPSSTMRYELEAAIDGGQEVVMGGRKLQVVRITLRGWAESSAGLQSTRARYEGVAWLSPELRRVVRYEATSRSPGNGAGFSIDEVVELVRVGRD